MDIKENISIINKDRVTQITKIKKSKEAQKIEKKFSKKGRFKQGLRKLLKSIKHAFNIIYQHSVPQQTQLTSTPVN